MTVAISMAFSFVCAQRHPHERKELFQLVCVHVCCFNSHQTHACLAFFASEERRLQY
jgi:hypothetical protein